MCQSGSDEWTVLPPQWVCSGHTDTKKTVTAECQSLLNSSEKCCMLCRSGFFLFGCVLQFSLTHTGTACSMSESPMQVLTWPPENEGAAIRLSRSLECVCRSRCLSYICARCDLKLQLPNIFTQTRRDAVDVSVCYTNTTNTPYLFFSVSNIFFNLLSFTAGRWSSGVDCRR